ncbi:MAG: radical SAM protein [Bacteroidia bacterium]|nr:radical SAM protein [Bacteroidia bacterium]
MIREEIVFGPIRSRRLGSSLGINLLPEKGKLCNFDCIYCECGWNSDGRDDKRIPTPSELRVALKAKLEDCKANNVGIDSITFSGDGEPTLNPGFPEIIDITLELRDRYYPAAKVSVLSNATMAHKDEIFEALRKVDNPIMKIDAPTDALAGYINRPCPGYSVCAVVESLKRFRGDFVLQTMFLKSGSFDSSDPGQLGAWMDIVRMLHPREVMVYTIDRETPQKGLEKFTAERMRELVQPLIDEGYIIQIKA